MYKIKIITSTTRPGRKGIAVARWIEAMAVMDEEFEVELLDLAEIGLPFLDEPNHPRLQKYEHEHTKQWSAKIDPADAFIFVLAEYNFGLPAPVKNAIDFLYKEWIYKPVGIVSYGGLSGGMRSMQMFRQVLSALYSLPLSASVSIPFFAKFMDEGEFIPEEVVIQSAENLLKELKVYCEVSRELRLKNGSL